MLPLTTPTTVSPVLPFMRVRHAFATASGWNDFSKNRLFATASAGSKLCVGDRRLSRGKNSAPSIFLQAILERNCAGRSVLAALDGWQGVVNWRHKFPNQGMQRSSLGISVFNFRHPGSRCDRLGGAIISTAMTGM
jgi:hypothetical protein